MVKISDIVTGSGMDISVVSRTDTDPNVFSQALATRIGFQYTVFKPVSCTEYKISGHEACSFIVTNPPDTTLGTGGRVLMSVVSYIPGLGMVSINVFANEQDFDKILPTFNTMIHSLHFGGNSISVGPAGTGIATGSSIGDRNLLH
jgi:hypothetical protein